MNIDENNFALIGYIYKLSKCSSLTIKNPSIEQMLNENGSHWHEVTFSDYVYDQSTNEGTLKIRIPQVNEYNSGGPGICTSGCSS